MSITRLLHSSMNPVLPVSIVISPSLRDSAWQRAILATADGPRQWRNMTLILPLPRQRPTTLNSSPKARGPRVQLTPREVDKLLIYVAADLARRRRARGLRLNLPEATALITEAMLEGARDGRSASEVMALARGVLSRGDVMEHVPELLPVVQVEATFPDGTKLV